MSVKCTSYINFDGDASEAIVFYQTVFGGTVRSDTFANYADRMPGAAR